jgi:hypothetical protein
LRFAGHSAVIGGRLEVPFAQSDQPGGILENFDGNSGDTKRRKLAIEEQPLKLSNSQNLGSKLILTASPIWAFVLRISDD